MYHHSWHAPCPHRLTIRGTSHQRAIAPSGMPHVGKCSETFYWSSKAAPPAAAAALEAAAAGEAGAVDAADAAMGDALSSPAAPVFFGIFMETLSTLPVFATGAEPVVPLVASSARFFAVGDFFNFFDRSSSLLCAWHCSL